MRNSDSARNMLHIYILDDFFGVNHSVSTSLSLHYTSLERFADSCRSLCRAFDLEHSIEVTYFFIHLNCVGSSVLLA